MIDEDTRDLLNEAQHIKGAMGTLCERTAEVRNWVEIVDSQLKVAFADAHWKFNWFSTLHLILLGLILWRVW